MRLPCRSCLLLLALGLGTGATASNLYQWKDANGVTHSSDQPPPGKAYQTRQIGTGVQAMEGAPQAEAAAAPDPRCATARQNLDVLGRDTPVQQDSDGDGQPDRTLDADERAAQKTLAEAAVRAYCPQGG